MDSTFFIDADDTTGPAHRAGLIAPLAGLVAAVALFVGTLSVVAQSHEAASAGRLTGAQAAPTPQIPSDPLVLADAQAR